MDLGPLWGEVFGVFSTRPIYNLPNLLEQSSDQVSNPPHLSLPLDCTRMA